MHVIDREALNFVRKARLEYSPNRLLDTVAEILQVKTDSALATALRVGQPILSKMRHGKANVSSGMLIRMHEITGLTIGELKYLLGGNSFEIRRSVC